MRERETEFKQHQNEKGDILQRSRDLRDKENNEQFYANKFENSEEMDEFLEKYNLLALDQK